MRSNKALAVILAIACTALAVQPDAHAQAPGGGTIPVATASRFAQIALRCVQREYPNKLDHVMSDSSEVRSPRSLHPSFYGCYDWHSAVHGHWMLVRLLRRVPDLPEAPRIRAVLEENLAASNVRLEVAYLDQSNRASFERTYGWAWLLKLAEELHQWPDADAQRWFAALEPLTRAIVARTMAFLPKQNYPIRTGVHPNTAFALVFALDYARAVGDSALGALVTARSIAYFGKDVAYPLAWEPGGEDFFSPALMEAALMRRVMPQAGFRRWFKAFATELAGAHRPRLLTPAVVTDRSDPKLVHLDGLNLSRAWCMRAIASALANGDAVRDALLASARIHESAGLSYVASGNYEGEHWLATFAVLMLSSK
jgi:hypothetical protein